MVFTSVLLRATAIAIMAEAGITAIAITAAVGTTAIAITAAAGTAAIEDAAISTTTITGRARTTINSLLNTSTLIEVGAIGAISAATINRKPGE